MGEGSEVVAHEIDGRVPLCIGPRGWKDFLIRHEVYLDEESFDRCVGYHTNEGGTEGYRRETEREGDALLAPTNPGD